MKTINVIRCWKNFQQDEFVTLAILLERFKGLLNFNITLAITHRCDTMSKSRALGYIEKFNQENNTEHSLTFLQVDDLDTFLTKTYKITEETVDVLKNQPVLYNVVLGFYARKKLKYDYVLLHDDDILYTRQHPEAVEDLLNKEIPFAIQHPYTFSDLGLVGRLTLLIGKDVFTPYSNKGLAASDTGLMGLHLSSLDLFTKEQVKELFENVFRYDSFQVDEPDPHFKDGPYSFNLYSQEQSFFSLVGRARAKQFEILDTNHGYAGFLNEEDLGNYNPAVHHYLYGLKNSNYRRGFIDYYLSKIDRKVDIFGEG